MGRPTKFDDQVADRICEAVSLGCTFALAAQAGGIDPETLRSWKARGREGEEPFSAFLGRIKKAEGEAANEALRVIRDAAKEGTWQAAAWLLERRYPKSYGRQNLRADLSHKIAPMSEDQAEEKLRGFLPELVALAVSRPELRAQLLAELETSNDSH